MPAYEQLAHCFQLAGAAHRARRALQVVQLAVGGRLAVAARTGQSAVAGLAHPASVAALIGLYARSVIARRRGAIRWRGRDLP